jgi:hypothetical protein
MMLFHDFCFKFILCKDINEFTKYHDIICDFFKSIDHEDVEVDLDVTCA